MLAPGKRLAHYQVLGTLGKGGMGEVYLANDTKLDRKVALKVLPAEMAADPERLSRFQREAKALAALNHPNIVTIHSVEQAEDVHFLTMELVEGKTLDARIPDGGMPWCTTRDLGPQLSFTHGFEVPHEHFQTHSAEVCEEGLSREELA